MKHLKLISMFILGGLVLTGCAVKSPTTAILEHKEKKVNQTIVEVPKWYKKLPNKKDIIFTAGAATAPDLQLSVDLATMNAKYVLADRINGKMDAMIKTFVTRLGTDDDINATTLTEFEKVTKNVVASVDVAGYYPEKIEVHASGAQFTAYVLLKYDDVEAQKIIINRIKKDQMVYSKLKSTKAWLELEKEVNKKLEEAEAQSLTNLENGITEIIQVDKDKQTVVE